MNENWDEDVRKDMSDSLDRLAPEDKKGQGLYRHDAEGSDDMPVGGYDSVVGGINSTESALYFLKAMEKSARGATRRLTVVRMP